MARHSGMFNFQSLVDFKLAYFILYIFFIVLIFIFIFFYLKFNIKLNCLYFQLFCYLNNYFRPKIWS